MEKGPKRGLANRGRMLTPGAPRALGLRVRAARIVELIDTISTAANPLQKRQAAHVP